MIRVRLRGADLAKYELRQVAAGARALAQGTLNFGAYTPYAYGIERGRHRGGRLARRAGGAFYIIGAWREVRPGIARRIARAIRQGPQAVHAEWLAIGRDLVRAGRRLVPVRSGRLSRSIQSRFRG